MKALLGRSNDKWLPFHGTLNAKLTRMSYRFFEHFFKIPNAYKWRDILCDYVCCGYYFVIFKRYGLHADDNEINVEYGCEVLE